MVQNKYATLRIVRPSTSSQLCTESYTSKQYGMKTSRIILFFLFFCGWAYGQNRIYKVSQGSKISYKVLEDNPEKAFTNFIAPELGMEYNNTGLSVYLGANYRYGIKQLFTLEGAAHYDLINVGGPGGGFLMEVGGFLPLLKKVKNKAVPVVLSYNPYAGRTYENGKAYNVEETKSFKIPSGQFLNRYGLRGGIHIRQLGLETSGIKAEKASGTILLNGIYLGGQITSQVYVRTKVNNDVERFGSGFTRIYADVIVFPSTSISNEILKAKAKSDGSLGWRVGLQWFVSPHDGKYKFLGGSVFGGEIGSRPLGGFMFRGYWAIALFKRR